MSSCKRYEQDLLLLAHGQLETEEAVRVRQHLHNCALCSERLNQLTGISLLLSEALYAAPLAPTFALKPRPVFLPARQHWLLSVLLGACVTLALLSVWKTAQSYASPVPAILPWENKTTDSCASPSKIVVAPPAAIKATPCPQHRHRAAMPLSSAPPRKL